MQITGNHLITVNRIIELIRLSLSGFEICLNNSKKVKLIYIITKLIK